LQSITNPFLLLFIGLVLTALIQSSSATTGILLTMCGQASAAGIELLTLRSCIFIILGINIGTCITAILASIGANTNAKRASLIHLMFNCFGTFIFFIIALFAPLDKLLKLMFPNNIQFEISMFHLFFNLTTTALLLPFVKQLTQLATLIIRDKKPKEGEVTQEDTEHKLQYVDNRLLATPSIAILMLRKEIINMANLAKQNLDSSMLAITSDNLSQEDDDKFAQTERKIDYLNGRLTKFIVEMSGERISSINEKELASYYHVLSDIERVGDYAENVIEYSKEIKESGSKFSETAKTEIKDMQDIVNQLYDNIMTAFANKDLSKEKEIWTLEDLVDKMQFALEKEHIERLRKQECSADAGSIFLSLISNIERIADHM
ncbi:MAG: Na/Pi symporter, partial [Clostridia bacterium]